MNNRVFFGQNDIRYFFYRYKDSKYYSISVLIIIIMVCIGLLLGIIIPQFNKYLSIRQEVVIKQAQIKIMNENINFINALNKTYLNDQLLISTRALPTEKDFTGILAALSDASIRSGVSLSDFDFSVGDVSSKSAKTVSSPALGSQPRSVSIEDSEKASPSIELVVIISGDINRVKVFLKEINEKLPLSEVVNLDNKNNNTTVSIKFYYKSYPEVSFKEDSPLVPLTAEKVRLIEKLALWKSSIPENVIIPVGTNSAVSLFE